MSERFFYFFPEVKVLKNENQVIIYDLLKQKMCYLSNVYDSDFVNANVVITPRNEDIIEDIVHAGYGFIDTKNIAVEELKNHKELLFKLENREINIAIAYIEINNICTHNCGLCTKANHQINSCLSCYLPNKTIKAWDLDFDRTILELKNIGVQSLVLCGGNPFDDEKNLLHALDMAYKLDFANIYILTSGRNISEKMVKTIMEKDLKLIVSSDSFDYNYISELFYKLDDRHIPQISKKYDIIDVNIDITKELLELRRRYPNKTVTYSYLEDKASTNVPLIAPTVNNYFENKNNIICSKGKIFIGYDEHIGLCPSIRSNKDNFNAVDLQDFILDTNSRLLEEYSCAECILKPSCHACFAIMAHQHNCILVSNLEKCEG